MKYKTLIHSEYSYGQTLAEVIVVIGIVILLVTGIVVGTTTSIGMIRDTKDRTEAIQYVQEGIEIARYTRDKGWAAFAKMGEKPAKIYCVGSDKEFGESTSLCSININTNFTRSITLELCTPPEPDCTVEKMQVTVSVTWANEAITQTTYLTPWQ